MATEPLLWLPGTSSRALGKMLKHKIDLNYLRPSRLDIEAQKAIIISKRCTCIFHVRDKNFYHLSDGYNGAAKGDVDPRIAGCARIVSGELKEGGGLCRGSHAELNAIGNCTTDTSLYEDVRMMVTLHPCNVCAKQIVNRSIRTVYYVWEYGRDEETVDYFKRMGVTVEKYTSPFLENWIKINSYDPEGLKRGAC